MYSIFGVILSKVRGVDDDINTVTAGTLTGVLYKSTGMNLQTYNSFNFCFTFYTENKV